MKHTFPVKPKFRGRSSVDCNINFICIGAGVQVVARVPKAGPVPPPTNVVIPAYFVNLREKELNKHFGTYIHLISFLVPNFRPVKKQTDKAIDSRYEAFSYRVSCRYTMIMKETWVPPEVHRCSISQVNLGRNLILR